MLISRPFPVKTRKTASRLACTLVIAAGTTSAVLPLHSAQAQEGPRFSISPRLYYVSITGPDQERPLKMPMGGLSAAYSISPRWDITGTGLYGKGHLTRSDGYKSESTRQDLEFVARYRIPDSPTYVTGGYRQLAVDEEMTSSTGALVSNTEVRIRAAQIGSGFASRASKSGRHATFANFSLGFGGFSRDELRYDASPSVSVDGAAALVDLNVGYQYAISGWLAASARYRVIAMRLWVEGSQSDVLLHGPEIAVTFRF